MPRVIIVGGGLAAARTAEALREHDYDGDVIMIAGERHLPYDRPPLSKGYLKGETPADEVELHDQQWYEDHRIDVRTGIRATSIDVGARRVSTDDGDLDYDDLVLATGSTPRALELPGSDLAGVMTLRVVEDSDRLIEALGRASGLKLAVVGGGWLGLEVASAFADAGAQVTILESLAQPLSTALGERMGAFFAKLHRDHGVDLRTGAEVTGFRPATDGGAVGAVTLAGGDTVPADLVLIAVGAAPNVELAQAAGLEVDNGVVVDLHGHTSAEHVYAVGDIANYPDPVLGRVRVEHWANALNQPLAVAAAIVGDAEAYDKLPFFYSDQYDLGMEYAGRGGPDDDVVIRGDESAGEFIAFWLRDGRITGGMNVNVWDVNEEIQRLIASRARVDRDRLADPSVDLADLG